MKPTSFDSEIKRPIGYWYEDGLMDLAIGGVLIAIGLLFFAELALPPGTLGGSLSAMGLPVVVFGGYVVAGRLVKAAKGRFIYPRTSYVDYRPVRRKNRPAALLLGAGIAIAVTLVVTTHPAAIDFIPALQGLLIGALLAYVAYTADVDRYYLLGGLSAAIGLAIAFSPLDSLAGSAVFFMLLGVCALAAGARTFRRYLRSTTPVAGV